MKKLKIIFVMIIVLAFQTWSQNTNPLIENVTFSISGSTLTVLYEVSDAEQTTVTISMIVSSDGGETWNYDYSVPGPVTGLGSVTVSSIPSVKEITWIYTGSFNPNFQIAVFANDETAGGSPCPGTPTVNYGGKIYNTIQIGLQCWLKENLNIGTRINGIQAQSNIGMIEKFCYFDNEAYCNAYGGLYQWGEMVQYLNGASNNSTANPPFSGNVKGICPPGWHIPSYYELKILQAVVNKNANSLKAIGQGTGIHSGTNTSGFAALLAGYSYSGNYYLLSYVGVFGSSTESDAQNAYMSALSNNESFIEFLNDFKDFAHSVRCLKD